jgi:hypothetical protein
MFMIVLELGAEAADVIDFRLYDVLREAEFRYAVHEHSARLVQSLEDGDVVPHLDEVPRDGKAGRAGTDDRNALARGRRNLRDHHVPRNPLEVRDEPLQAADGDRLAPLAQDARHLALLLLGADAAAHRGESVVLLDLPGGLDELPLPHEVDELGDLDIDRAPLDARGVLALDAAGRLHDGQVGGEAEGDFPEVVPPHFRRLLRHRLPGDAERLGAGGGLRVGHYLLPPVVTGAAPGAPAGAFVPAHLPSLCS